MEEQKLLRRKKKAEKDNSDSALVSVCTDLANLYMEEGRYDFAIDEYSTVANIYKKQRKQLEYAIANRGIGEAYLGIQKFKKALQHQIVYLDTVRELKNKLEEQRALATIGHTYLSCYLDTTEPDRNNLTLANKFFTKSLAISQSLSGQASKVEIADMSARLFANMGLVQDCMSNFEKASELLNKSINLCKAHDLYEQLQRGYVSLAALLVKQGDHRSALQQYNLAAEAAKKIRNKPALLAGILLSKSEILVKLGDLRGAKSALLKAYKLKIPDVKEHKTIEKNLRVVASMSLNEDKILVTEITDYARLKPLYEKMGDGACELKLFDKALDYYKKMLDSAVKAELTGSDLASCFYSLAETYIDNGQFGEAVEYFEQELKLCRSFKDSLNTLSKIADTKESANAPISEVQDVYNRAIELCQSENNLHEEGRMLKRFILYLRRQKQNSEAFKYEQGLAKLNYHSSDSDGESSEVQTGSEVGADIDLDAITDVSGDSDNEQASTSRRRTKNYAIKKNDKGESQLHTACIKGQLNVVHHLLEQGHPVNPRDNCGWLPLHEACINGHLEVVKLLLEKGAWINDRGGTQCEGVTPLHDAASNGHLLIVQLLLSKGASAVAKTDEGNTVLDFLQKWRSTAPLDDQNQNIYESIVEQIAQVLDKTGHVTEKNANQKRKVPTPSKHMRRSALIGLEDDDSAGSSNDNQKTKVTTPSKDMRRSALIGLEDDDSAGSSQNSANDYKDVMENLRRRNEAPPRRRTVAKRSALLSADEVVDDWLEDDVGKSFKKRKTNSPAKSHSLRRSNEEVVPLEDSPEALLIPDEDSASNYYEPHKTSPKKIVRKKQTKLTNFGHTRSFIEPDSTSSPRSSKTPTKQLKRTRSFDIAAPTIEPTLSVDVRINKKLYRVPILLSQVSTHTIKWLADEAAARYARKEYMIPTLELETKNGAILADDDPISVLFPMGATQAEEIEARIIKVSVPPIIDRYKEACQDMTVATRDDICQILQEFTVSLDFANHGLKGASLAPLFKVLNRQINLLELDLSGNFLTNECFQFLGASLASLENLCRLNLNCTNLMSRHVQVLIDNLSADVSYKVSDLDLSDNLIGDQSFESLALLTRLFQLKKLNLSGNKFTRDVFNHSYNKELTLLLDQIEEFDVSDNDLSNDALIRILSWLHFPTLRSLNVSRNSVTDGFLRQMLSVWTEVGKLKICKLSRCHVHDSDLFDLLRVADSLETLDVSYNTDLTSISLRRLLQADIQNLDLFGCENILKYFTEFSRYLDESSRDQSKGKTLKISLPENSDKESEYLIQMWRELYGGRTIVELSSRFLCLSLSK